MLHRYLIVGRPVVGRFVLGVLAMCVVVLGMCVGASGAFAGTPAWTLDTVAMPTNLPPGGEGRIVLEAANFGDAPALGSSSPIVLAEKLPTGLSATAISGEVENESEALAKSAVKCELAVLRCEYLDGVSPFGHLVVTVTVGVAAGSSGRVINEASVTGGGAVRVVSRESVVLSSTPAVYGVEKLQLAPINENGSPDTQAGSHPFELTTTVGLNTINGKYKQEKGVPSPEMPKDLRFDLPAGLIGDANVAPQCSTGDFSVVLNAFANACPPETAIGVATAWVDESEERDNFTVPLYNLVPSVGEPARFGFEVAGVPIILDTSLRTGGNYGVVVSVNDITQALPFVGSQVTFWGAPAETTHQELHGWGCLGSFRAYLGPCVAPPLSQAAPLLTMPTSCTGVEGMRMTLATDSWAQPGAFKTGESLLLGAGDETLGLDGCNRLPFSPSISVAPDGQAGSTPTGLLVGVHVPQQAALNPTGLSPADVRDTTVTLPEGVQISPAGAGGLSACSLEQIGLEVDGSPSCPESSKIGTAEIKTPLLPQALEGAVYLADQDANPFGSLVAMYIVAEDPTAGVVVKFAGKVSLNPVTGQLVSTFENTPQLPFEDLKLHFFGSARAPLSTPAACGSYTTHTTFEPWSGGSPAEPSSTFQITSGPNSAPCSSPQPFTPGFQAGSTNIQAGAFTPFTLTMSRPDADQTLSGVEMQMPPGLSGDLSHVELCPEPQASQGACPAGSLIGHTVVSVGLGGSPYTVEGGQVFLTGPYKGAPFGLSILNPAQAGPFNLGDVVVRAKVEVDPVTAALRILSDPLPTIIDGIPLQIQHINVTVDRQAFTFNPTNCSAMSLTATLSSSQGAQAAVSTQFQVTNCASLAFKPTFTASTQGKTSRLYGASLHVALGFPGAAQGSQANIRQVKVELPRQLPSQLKTLQKACTAAQFQANPGGCPPASIVGHAKAITPILPVPLEGPAYFVSHGGEAFPSLEIVLQGYGVTIDLTGTTFINEKTGITSSTFKTVPDVPVSSFELTLPEEQYPALAANGNLCKASKLLMPTEFQAQNGVRLTQSTHIQVTGCPKTKHRNKTHHNKHRTKHGHRKVRKSSAVYGPRSGARRGA